MTDEQLVTCEICGVNACTYAEEICDDCARAWAAAARAQAARLEDNDRYRKKFSRVQIAYNSSPGEAARAQRAGADLRERCEAAAGIEPA